jgi:hypothetical protein
LRNIRLKEPSWRMTMKVVKVHQVLPKVLNSVKVVVDIISCNMGIRGEITSRVIDHELEFPRFLRHSMNRNTDHTR